MVTQRRCGFARDDRLGVNRGRFFSFWAASFRLLAAALPFRGGAMAILQRRRLRRWDSIRAFSKYVTLKCSSKHLFSGVYILSSQGLVTSLEHSFS